MCIWVEIVRTAHIASVPGATPTLCSVFCSLCALCVVICRLLFVVSSNRFVVPKRSNDGSSVTRNELDEVMLWCCVMMCDDASTFASKCARCMA